ncbi:carbamoyl-phosphate synthase small subunit [Thalassoporum mexicanum PCC 7367]|uniref:glutamine-hydrolyzing carbamoyl-phosphate synthase small subunit n=1 Tax=Thalassoporum mexicanum TaxID=3457544 RepID=UPI00029FE254|nr:glutamine-hydrolyzing carbamoyl-phosphate synthase small subunit [Pseudanabaena sp. PCC 7367]AFY71053.1 carbamoyl-phosphate synthase small subunit [Pseudanabaena sp. PCC 7367]
MVKQAAILVLADGSCYRGFAFGATGTAIGEVVFNTGMTGYQEVLTDPSYSGQIITFTYPELGNTGVTPEDEESDKPKAKGAIARNITYVPSNWRSQQSLPDYLKTHNIVGIAGIDTRALTRKLRSMGAMNGGISTEILDPEELLAKVKSAPSMQGLNLAQGASTTQIYEWQEPTIAGWEYAEDDAKQPSDGEQLTVVAIDFGVKRNILRRLVSYGCRVIVVPADTPTEKILEYNPDGIFLSNGPGDPAAVTEGVKTAQALLKANKPMFGICLGHQILGLSMGGETFKLKFGHRGLNQPAQNQAENSDRRVEITSQNHGFALDSISLDGSAAQVTHWNLNDKTVAGLEHKELPIFSVQYHPEASPGPHDADYLFEKFVAAMRSHKKSAVSS